MTKHDPEIPEGEQLQPNHLISEKSPFLLQHAYNPVNWYPWGVEAFRKALAEDKPIFLSIGYSTCHWCHQMAHESFEDPDVARILNEVFVAIKVDREERPDVDAIYMAACQSMTGSGGWPLTIVMTPDKKPFVAGTYFPKNSQGGRIGLLDLAKRVQDLWANRREEVLASADNVTNVVQHLAQRPVEGGAAEPALGQEVLDAAYAELSSQFDGMNGGFGSSPKFPIPHNLLFLLRYWHRSGDAFALEMVEQTLQAMHHGGIYDHVGFGFHRYATDPYWLVPHFEKMLYDQALLALVYLEAFQVTRKEEYAEVVREIFAYVLRDLLAPEGGFYAAEDADSEGVEGKFYTWTYDEVAEMLPADQFKICARAWDIQKAGNYR
ncbi:MAG TPA: thioredoxin domain-containing protein, partial [Candidatus Lokiarchaeia archaeon]|nr:thioredoxin domain-containing protein [Candidatus Lokiarchaeia archaeon]